MKRLSISLWLSLLGSLWSQQGDPFIKDTRPLSEPSETDVYQNNVSILTEFFEIDSGTLATMLSDESLDKSDGPRVRRAVEDYLGSGKATLVDSSLVSSRGGRSTLTSTAELIYPVEWDPGSMSQGTGVDRREAVPKVIDGVTYWPPRVYPHPTTFEMRQVGTILSVDAKRSLSGPVLDVTLDAEFVGYDGRALYNDEAGGTSNAWAEAWLPIFTTMRQTSSYAESSDSKEWTPLVPADAEVAIVAFSRSVRMHRLAKPTGLPREDAVTVIVEWVEVPVAWFQAQVGDVDRIDSGSLRRDAQSLIESEQAQVIGLVSAAGTVGEDLRSHGVCERIYPTDWVPARLPSPNAAEDTAEWPPSSFPAPTAYQTRNLGAGLDVVVHDKGIDQGYEVSLGGGILTDADDLSMNALVAPTGKVTMTTMPLFLHMNIDTTVLVHRGETVLLGALTPREKDLSPKSEKRVLVFARLAQ